MNSFNDIHQWLSQWQPAIAANFERRLVVVEGECEWQQHVAEVFYRYFNADKRQCFLWGEDQTFLTGTTKNYRHQLGCEYDLVIFSDPLFHPDAFSALSGTLKAGGILLWLKPEVQSPGIFMQRVMTKFIQDAHVIHLTSATLPIVSINTYVQHEFSVSIADGCLTQEQHSAVNAICHVAKGHRNRPLILTADRGRGKSSALALACIRLITSETQVSAININISAPSPQATTVFFQQLRKHLPDGRYSPHKFCYRQHTISFIAVDVLLATSPSCNLLLIDEAAGIPVHLLLQLSMNYNRIVFTSTQHGYEGAGRGFAIKFRKMLKVIAPKFQSFHLNQPIRWRDNDPLEQLVFDTFLFDSSLEVDTLDQKVAHYKVSQISQAMLAKDEKLLEQVFAVLVSAHYKTTPSDLKLLLDNQKVRIFIAIAPESQTVIAVALVIEEGKATAEEVAAVKDNERQLKDQFTPQYLLRHLGVNEAFEYRYWRVNRIAVIESQQQQGVGGELLTFIEQQANNENVDCLTTSFAANSSIVAFWQASSYVVVNLGISKDQASGEHAALMLKPLTQKSIFLADQLVVQFYRKLSFYLMTSFKQLPADLVLQLLLMAKEKHLPSIETSDLHIVHAYLAQQMQFMQSAFSLQQWLINKLSHLDEDTYICLDKNTLFTSSEQALNFIVAKILQQQLDEEIAWQYSLTGKKQIQQQLRKVLRNIIER
ncbi:GNAT family N-acetyltransferase [Thalassotalea sediminis]|uniref:GNAT family N-acetyltransferase n=1 Tax=Thalassotalea sediminis TaxID=1759089 RepID=UPI002572CF66|nr:GNAT family N-acetyltransferase [Thalassotalea sediminis]